MRAFIALPIDSGTTTKLNTAVSLLKKQAWSNHIRWFPASNYHVTIQFLGSKLETNKVNEIVNSIDNWSISESIPPSRIKISGIQLFPSEQSAHTIVASIQADDFLLHIASLVENQLKSIGLMKSQQDFRPHISLGRIERQTDLTSLTIPAELAYFKNTWLNIDSITLYQSELTQTSPIYTPLKTIYLHPKS